MLGRLARWLRMLGFDTLYDAGIADDELVRRAHADGRILLTRDRHLLRELRPARALEVRQDAPLDQLRDVVDALALPRPAALFSRCMLCNAELEAVAPGAAAPGLPADVQALAGPVYRCPACARLYWEGSHTRRMRAALDHALPGWRTPP